MQVFVFGMTVVKWGSCILYPHSVLSKITWTSRNKQCFLKAALFNVTAAVNVICTI